jgi:hypothetical protein
MPTGIEEAGLVLAVFPILCSLIQQYLTGLESINSFIGYSHDLEVLLFKLNAEHRLFKTSCFLLLSPVGDLRVINSLIEDPGGQHWRDQELMKAVIRDLGEEVWEECIKFIHMMQGIMRKIQDVLEKNLGSKVEAFKIYVADLTTLQIQTSAIARLLHQIRVLWRQISFSFSLSERKEFLGQL